MEILEKPLTVYKNRIIGITSQYLEPLDCVLMKE